jgi:ADP-L-glycero-D-manno-heptose 6-epimerase
MKILLTGHKGFIGRNMLQRLNMQHDVYTYEWGDSIPDFEKEKFDWVVHLGAISSTTERNIEKVLLQNYDFTRMLIQACLEYSINIQFASSASIYGLGSDFTETAKPDPRTPYAWSKYLCERELKMLSLSSKNPITWQCFRYFNVFGPGEEDKGSQASPWTKFLKEARTDNKISIFENSDNFKRDFIHVSELISLQMLFLDINESGLFNIGSGKATSFREIAELISKLTSAEIIEIPIPSNLIDSYQTYTCADMTKVRKILNEYEKSYGKNKELCE